MSGYKPGDLSAGKLLRSAGRYIEGKLGATYNWAKADPPRALHTGLAAYHAFHGYQGGYIPYEAIYHAAQAYDRKKPRRKRFYLRRQAIYPSNRYLRREAYRYKQSQGWIPYDERETVSHQRASRFRYWKNIRTPPRLKRSYYTRRTPPNLRGPIVGILPYGY